MIRIASRPQYEPQSAVISGFSQSLYDAFVGAFDRGNKPVWLKILHFIFKNTIAGIGNNSIPVINQLIFLPTFYLRAVLKNEDAAKTLIEQTSLNFKSLSFFFRNSSKRADFVVNEPVLLLYYEGLLTFYNMLIEYPASTELDYALNEFNQIADDSRDFDTRFLIYDLFKNGGSALDAEKIQAEANKKAIVNITHRRATLALKSWIVYLYTLDKVAEERVLLMDNQIKLHYQFFEDLLSDVIFLRKTETRDYLGLNNWDFMERPTGEVYSPPSVYDWIIVGLCFYLLKADTPHVMMPAILIDDDHQYLLDAVNKTLEYFRVNLFKWRTLLGLPIEADKSKEDNKTLLEEVFNDRVRKITTIFGQLKQNHQAKKNKDIAEEPLNAELVDDFKSKVAEKWKSQCSIYDIFEHFQRVTIKDNDDGLIKYGATYLLAGFKIMFVENNYQQIYGSGDLGSVVGRSTDSRFLNQVLNSTEKKINYADLITGLDENIQQLSEKGSEVNFIIIPPEFSYKTNILESVDFRRKESADDLSDFGHYKNIPVFTFYTSNLENQVVLGNFDSAFSLEIYENPDYFYKRLYINLRLLTDEEITAEFAKDPEGWKMNTQGLNFTDDQARKKIATAVYMELWSHARFTIDNPNAFKIFEVTLPD